MRPPSLLALLVVILALAGCSPKPEEGSRPQGTERERDSVIGASRLPGAGGVRGALRESDSAAARNARLDSVANQP
jgi:hypothetical protein